jgi:hypothetical protein
VMQKLSGGRKKKPEDKETSPNVTADAKQAVTEKSS